MSRTARILLLSAAVAATLAACQRKEDKAQAPAAPAPAAAPAMSNTPVGYDSKTPYAAVKLTLPQAIKTTPALHAALYADTVRDLKQFEEGAQADLSEAGGGPNPYEKTIAFAPGAETGKLVSLARTDFEFTGGAHPNTSFDAVIWDKTTNKRLGFADLFRPGADLSVLDKALCAAANAAKQARSPGSEAATLDGKMWTCPKVVSTPFVLTPGTTPGKAGGVTFLMGPYQIGPYSDGPYWIALPQSALRALLNPAYADQFDGAPAKAGDVTPKNG
ncbi:DUF3298 domain-containing protein [Brevundimonas vesicularis]|uniref:DUF3298 and DUF4163 domain-containing protein n=1 Tax=Brevundimonas vesicularis TaxID=41276 RepID=A0ABU4KLZ1_BREVE|nr:DUF3298 domain-containing protein [Brevundimonas vesicularis]MDX2334038.1 DUF3298 and DUF4163 domain-containing protein [Brevundimonas vesicularis]